MSDPRGAGATWMPPLMQMAIPAKVCAATQQVWVVPVDHSQGQLYSHFRRDGRALTFEHVTQPGVPLTFPPHVLDRPRVVLVVDVKVQVGILL